MREINRIVIHCSATIEGQDIDSKTIRGWHVNGRGWSDIGYHYIVRLNGDIEAGRPIERMGAGVRGHNRDTIHVCYIGGVDEDMNPKDTRTPEQKESIIKLIKRIKSKLNNKITTHGHNEFSSKACPSFIVKNENYDRD